MRFWRTISPRGAIADLIHEWRQPNPYRWQVLGVSVALTFTMMVLLIPESQRAEPRRPQITYITSFAPDRSDEEIVASNVENEKRKAQREAAAAARAERRKEAAKALGRAMGMDVDAMEERIERERAAEEAAAEQARSASAD